MKKLNQIPKLVVILILLMFVFAATTKAQNIAVSTYIEQTKVSPKIGYMMGYHFGEELGIEAGAFYQTEIQAPSQLEATEYNMQPREKTFAGVFFNYPAYNGKKIDVIIQLRTGLVNGENFTITPSIEGKYDLAKNLSVSAGIGTRCLTPSMIGRISYRLGNIQPKQLILPF